MDAFRDAVRATQVLRPNAGGQAVVGVVGIPDHFLFVVERRDRDNWTENFFTICAARYRQAGDDCWRKEITGMATLVNRLRRFPAERDLAAFFLRKIDIELYLIELRLAHDRALLGRFFQRIAAFQLRRCGNEAIDEILVSRALDEHARTAQTNLALVRE